jgi:transcriptional regulator with XRE-family HTH domain
MSGRDSLAPAFGRVFLRMREDRQYSMEDVAVRTWIHVERIAFLESGAQVPTLDEAHKFAVAIGVPLDDLVRRVVEAEPLCTDPSVFRMRPLDAETRKRLTEMVAKTVCARLEANHLREKTRDSLLTWWRPLPEHRPEIAGIINDCLTSMTSAFYLGSRPETEAEVRRIGLDWSEVFDAVAAEGRERKP